MKFVVAIDGPAAAGKGTIAKAIANHFKLSHLDTGLLYRGVGKKALAYSRTSYYPEVAKQLALDLKSSDLESSELRTPEIAEAASKVALIPEVREVLLDFQRSFANQDGGAILDGRDIGTVISSGHEIGLENLLKDVISRDKRDAERTSSPLIIAHDAIKIDTSSLSIKDAVWVAINCINEKYKAASLLK